MSAGFFGYIKGYDMLVEVAKIIFKNNSDWKWNIYGKYLIVTLMERNRFIQKEEKQSNNILKTHKKLSIKFVYNFFSHIKKKMDKDKELDYNEFITFYYLGLPNRIRNKIW